MSVNHSNAAPSQQELKACVAVLQRGLLEPESLTTSERRRVKLCPVCLMPVAKVFIRIKTSALQQFPKHLFLTGCHGFLVDAMQILTTLPTAEDERKIWPELRRAHSACQIHRQHFSDEKLLSGLLLGLAIIVTVCLQSIAKVDYGTATTRFKKNGAWPESIAEILPGESTTTALFNLVGCWSRHSDGPFFDLLARVVRLPSIPRDVGAALMNARHVFLPAYLQQIASIGHSLQQTPVGSLEFDNALLHRAEYIRFSTDILAALRANEMSPHEFIAGYEDQVNAAFNEVVRGESFLPRPANPSIADVRVLLFMNRREGPTPDQLEAEYQAMNNLTRMFPTGGDPYTRFYKAASAHSRVSQCWVKGCQNYGKEGATKLMRCGRCRAVQYCSQECQRADWKDKQLPHRAVCQALARIQATFAFSTGSLDGEAFSAACRTADIQVEELLLPYYHLFARSSATDPTETVAEGIEIVRKLLDPPA